MDEMIPVDLLLQLCFFLHEKIQNVEHKLLLKEKEKVWQILVQQISSESKNHLETFKEMQQRSPLLQHAKYKVLAGAPPQQKKLLTVGISSVQHPRGSYLLDTLQSVFEASSEPEQKSIVVLVHLSDPDPEWLRQTAANISRLFAPHIDARKLLVIHGLPGGSPLPGNLNDASHTSPCEALYSRQKVDYALLMNFASSLSDYFLLMEDHVHCSPKFVSAIYWALSAWEKLPWVILEFSSLNISGKVFRTSDLSRLTSFFLLFLKDIPAHLLLSKFSFLLGQTVPISLAPNLFHSWGYNFTAKNTCYQEEGEEEENLGKPNNPPASFFTNMMSTGSTIPEYAYFMSESYFQTQYLMPGHKYTVVFDKPHKVSHIKFLTGMGKQRIYYLQQGQVELGYEPVLENNVCARYSLLGPLVKGKFYQKVYYEEGFVEAVKCVRLLVTAPHDYTVWIRNISIWIKSGKG
ncbi:alpha-1,6-mannosyl-glycoprotein 4-beta-N-acetylglucosaminyltransferase-like isoform X2 [Eulemur rufifrons]|uniref:alpha-1,6-mannosyl-glycoprotein 4-beta-N-acetylglucosaminyltransferase-like isoform X2 n=1 Tax=Eulemur rufifrons TaxID=859984 RepID=UPI003743EF47